MWLLLSQKPSVVCVAILLQILMVCCNRMRARENSKFAKCNESIGSVANKKNGSVKSPQYPNPYQSGVICEYEFTAEGQERVQLNFTSMDLHYTAGDPNDPYECPSQDSVTVYVYIQDQEEKLGEFCGKKLPPLMMSNGHKMKVVFKSDVTTKDYVSGFKIDYSFRTDYGVLGNGVQDKREICTFSFDSKMQTHGYFTSPNFGGLYPRNTECHYIFYGKRNEHVKIEFPVFEVDGIIPRCDLSTESDLVSFSNWINAEDRLMPKFCGSKPPQTYVVSEAAFFRVTFKSNHRYDATGFNATYVFQKAVEDENTHVTPAPTTQDDNAGAALRHGALTVSMTTIILLFQTVIFFVL